MSTSNNTICINLPQDPFDTKATANYFTCPIGDTCIALAGRTTVICCPPVTDCMFIQPISCDLSLQNALVHPDSAIKTLALSGKLPECGTGGCCPYGYTCTAQAVCEKNADQSVKLANSSGTAVPPPSLPTTTDAFSSFPLSTNTDVGGADSPQTGSKGSSGVDAKLVIPIVIICVLVLLIFCGLFWFWKRYKRKKRPNGGPPSPSFPKRNAASFLKPELDGNPTAARYSLKYELSGTRDPVELPWSATREVVELPATPLPTRFSKRIPGR
ncbi:hypothetical protein QBC47DRAFT_414825 [Echria macrotheca]|uniref:Uncharacterized protein n=1 Tax=Echria macrotheca TaxID=438768 RepID=A0AAJ0FA64_9PEZI|nr:hypothetical protein QBC47DRAFT_414825 [Echria macrotheca]